ncbi:MAG: hypothetical protein K2K96_02320 [Lachnospiraceae bacterium]|nr:hypothetical protein [Lachnospiraceae bacterium]
MADVSVQIVYLIIGRIIQLGVWLVLCLGITAVAAVLQWISKKKLIHWVIRIAVAATACIIIWMLVDDLIAIIKYGSMWFGIWLALCFAVTAVTVVVQLINKKLRKKKPIHWGIKLAGYAAFYAISLFAIMKLLGSYPGNWISIDKEYRELMYELYNQELNCYGYESIREGSNGEIVITFKENSHISDQNLETTMMQRDYIALKTATEEFMEVNENFQGKRINIAFRLSSGRTLCNIYNFDPRTGEMGTDAPCWFATGIIYANNCTELAEFYYDFFGISAGVRTMDDMQELANLRNLTCLQLYVGGAVREDKELEKQYLEELNTLLPDCEIHLNEY